MFDEHGGVRSHHSTRRRESRSHGEGCDGITQPKQETQSGEKVRRNCANLNWGIARSICAEASGLEEPGAGKPHAGIREGAAGQPAGVYLDDIFLRSRVKQQTAHAGK